MQFIYPMCNVLDQQLVALLVLMWLQLQLELTFESVHFQDQLL